MLFSELGLSAELLSAVEKQGYREATPIQREAIPPILEGRDILASAQTGTGKTAGFTLPLLQRLMASRPGGKRRIRSLILVPTPGRLLDHVEQRTIDLSGVEILVLDEADRMLDMGFIRDIRKILKLLPTQRQNLLFSATFSPEIRSLAADFLSSPVEISVAPRNTTAERVIQLVHPVDKARKRELLSHRIGAENWRQVLVFTRTKHGADRLSKQLSADGLDAAAIHVNKSKNARTKALADFKSGKIRVLVATDIAARGLDIDSLPHVVNYELPHVPEDYVHRIGRTARAGLDGHAVSLVCVDEDKLLRDIERLLNVRIEKEVIPGYEPDPRIRPEPLQTARKPRPQPRRNGPRRQNNQSRGRKRA